MQISSGWARGMRLEVPAGAATRPTGAKVRAATLNILAPSLEDAVFLDLFAGSGAMGLEAMSRGARRAVFVEVAGAPLGCLKRNLAELARRAAAQSLPAPDAAVLAIDALQHGARIAGHGPFDLIFADPPYRDSAAALRLLPVLAAAATAAAVLAFETAAGDGPALAAGAGPCWEVLKQKAYGDTMITIFTKTSTTAEGAATGGES
jgi:16S rRNA (guanine(966)-N(2))-methyltransferase RsmD